MNLVVSNGPHIRLPYDSSKIMWLVALTLLLPAGAGVYFFGWPALVLITVITLSAVISEIIFQLLAKRPVTVADGSAVVTGLLLALIVPSTLPWWQGVIGAALAIVLVKGLFGGLGFNIFNPALAARAILLASWPVAMTSWVRPFDAVTTATPLYLAKVGQAVPGYWDLFLGNRAGSLGETSVLMILIGAVILLALRVIDWPAPTAYIGTVALLALAFGHDPLFYVLSGGLMLGAFYMATDYVTAPITIKGRFIFGAGCGVLTMMIRLFGGFPEGVNYAILIMNIFTPMIDRYARPRLFGERKRNA